MKEYTFDLPWELLETLSSFLYEIINSRAFILSVGLCLAYAKFSLERPDAP